MALPPLRQGEVRQDAVINAPVDMPNNPPAPVGVGGIGSILEAPDQSERCCGWIGERFSALGSKLQDLLLSFRDWLKTWFVAPQADNNVNPVDGDQVNNPDLNPPVNNLQPTPELILQTFGEEIRYILPKFTDVFRFLDHPDVPPAQLDARRGEIREHLVRLFDTFPEIVRLNIMNRMEELKREANPGVVLVNNWAHRVIHDEVQYPDEAVPIALAQEMNIFDENHFIYRAVTDLLGQLGGPFIAQIPATLRVFQARIHEVNLGILLYQNEPTPANLIIIQEIRGNTVEAFLGLPEELQNQVKARMVEIAALETPEVREIPNWADRVIQGQVRIPGEAEDREIIVRHLDILALDSVFYRAIDDVINAAPLPEPEQA